MNVLKELDLFQVGPSLEWDWGKSRKARRRLIKATLGERFSANYVIDVGGTCQLNSTLPPNIGTIGSGGFVDSFRSGIMIGQPVDLLNANAACNVIALGTMVTSGPLTLQVQTTDSTSGGQGAGATLSGNFTDPTSGLAVFPSFFLSGGILNIGQSGNTTIGVFNSGILSGRESPLSGFAVAAFFQRVGRYARVNVLSGFYAGPLQVGILSQLKTTGSGGGQSQQPGSGTVSV